MPFLAIIFTLAFSQLSAALSISELIDLALKNNKEAQYASWAAQKADANLDLSGAAFYPAIRVKGSIADGRDYKYPRGHEINYTRFDATTILNYLIFDSGERRATQQAAYNSLIASEWQANRVVQKVIYDVLMSTYAYLFAKEILQSRQSALLDIQPMLEAAEELNRVGLRPINDVCAIQAFVSDAKMNVVWQKAETKIAESKLATLIGVELEDDFEVVPLKSPNMDNTMHSGLNELVHQAYRQRADLMAREAELNSKFALKKKIKSATLPKLNFNADTGYKRYINDKANGFHYNVCFNVDAPLFSGFDSYYQTKIVDAEIQMTTTEIDRLKLEISHEVYVSNISFIAAQEAMVLAVDYLNLAEKTFSGGLKKYQAGTQSIFDLISSQKQLTEARIKLGEAKTKWYKALAQLAYASGTLASLSEVLCWNN